MAKTYTSFELEPWTPKLTPLPQNWEQLVITLLQETRGSPHPYVLEVRYDSQRVGNLLRSWGLPWPVVVAGYLWEYDEQQIRNGGLSDVEEVLSHIDEANLYARYIKDENLPPLLTPPYRDLGALLIAVAIYFVALETLQQQSNEQLYTGILQTDIESISYTLLNIATRLGMWHLKHAIEDLSEQILNAERYNAAKQEHKRILQQDALLLEDTRQLLLTTYQEATQQSIVVHYTTCSITGMKRREQDAHTTVTSQKTEFRGFDLVTFDIIVPTIQECYAALGILSQLGQIQDRVTDLIANPKANGCSHIALGLVLKPQNSYTKNLKWLETYTPLCQLQIATHLMYSIAWYGCLYLDCYKLYTRAPGKRGIGPSSIEQLWNSKEGRSFLKIKEDLAVPRTQLDVRKPIVVHDKNRTPISLPKGATALDFSYALGKDIGEHTAEVLINNRKAPLYRTITAGDIVEIRTSNEKQVQESWVHENYAITPEARQQIKEALSHNILERRGSSLLHQELERYHYALRPEVLHKELSLLVKQYNLGTPQEYLERLDIEAEQRYTPKWAALEIMHQITEQNEPTSLHIGKLSWVPRLDMQPVLHGRQFSELRFCNFCQPTYPRDAKIMGRLRKQSGELVVHKESCPHLIDRSTSSHSTLLPMIWQLQPPAFRVAFFIRAQDRKGLIFDVAKQLRQHQSDIRFINADAESVNQGEALIHFRMEAHTDKEVLDIWQELYKIDNVTKVEIDASATPIHVYDRLQKQRKERESIPNNTTAEVTWKDTDSTSIQQPRSLILHNPFDISRPAETKMFFGRSTETEIMQRELCDGTQGKALILYGPLRSGKSSICKNFLERLVQSPFWGVLFTLQNATEQSEETIFKQLAEKISKEFGEQLWQPAPDWENFNEPDPQVHFRRILENCFAQLPGARLVLVLDEFGGAIQSYQKHILEYRFFTYWKELISDFPQLSLILVLPMSSHSLLTSKNFANVFSFAQHLPISFLDTNSAQQLLADPLLEQFINIHSSTLALALKLTGGNPYYMTLLGQQLIHHLNREIHQQLVTDADLRLVVDQLIEKGSNQNFDFLKKELQNNNESRILEGIVELTGRTKQSKVQLKKIASWLDLSPSTARRHLDRLRIGLILDENGPFSNPYYSFKIELVRLWLKRNHWFFERTK